MRKPRFFEQLEAIKNPPMLVTIVVYALAVCFLALTFLCLCFSKFRTSPMAITVYVLTGLFILYGALLFVNVKKGEIKNFQIKESTKKVARRATNDYGYRTKIFSACSSISSLINAIFNVSLACLYDSVWFASLSAVYFVICFARLFILIRTYWGEHIFKTDEEQQEYENILFVATGIIISTISLLSIFPFVFMLDKGITIKQGDLIPLIGSVIFAVCKIYLSVRNMIKAQKTDSFVAKTLRYINMIDAIFSIFQLVIVSVYSFSQPNDKTVFLSVSITTMILTFAYGIVMVIQGTKDGWKISEKAKNVANKLEIK